MNTIKNFFLGFGYIIFGVLTIFSFSASFIGGIWLLFLGAWVVVISGFIISILMPFIYSIVMIPSQLFIKPAIRFSENDKKGLAMIFVFLSGIYSNFIMLCWVNLVFSGVVIRTLEQGAGKLIPLIIFAYAVTMAPLSYMAKGEPEDSKGTNLGLILAFITFIIWTILWLSGGFMTGWHSLISLALIIIPSIISCRQIIEIMKERGEEKIDLRKVNANLFVLKHFSFQAAESFSKFDKEQEELLKFATKSIKEIDPLGGIPLGFSWEFVATYPDVFLWWNKLSDEEQEKILENFDENDFLDENENINPKYLKMIVDSYKKYNIKLECFY
ncbi:MAG: hypothetical protein WC735_02240 [Candidatus Paceibacterota bacterium]|jgi:hypothetical protein